MKKLVIPYLNYLGEMSDIETVSATLDTQEKHAIDQQPWKEFPYRPQAHFSIGHSGDCLFLKYYVSESTVRAYYFRPNEPVYKDTCVEFFIAFDGERDYYNFEFNIIGTCKLNFGNQRNDRKLISEKAISSIRFSTLIRNDRAGNIYWEIVLSIPLSAFSEHTFNSLKEKQCRGNFYKCGDELPQPHFLSWNNVISPEPDFHLPQYFGEIHFQ
jgi:hypothetical protein